MAVVGQVTMFAGIFAPSGWVFCDGQLLDILSYNNLFVVLGTKFGGDGIITFAIPDMRGRVPMHTGQGLGFGNHVLGEKIGAETHTITEAEMPSHSHKNKSHSSASSLTDPVDAFMGDAVDSIYNSTTDGTMGATTEAGNNRSFNIMQPSLGINFIIAFQGTIPVIGESLLINITATGIVTANLGIV